MENLVELLESHLVLEWRLVALKEKNNLTYSTWGNGSNAINVTIG